MVIQKVRGFEVVCPHCGSKIYLSAEEYFKYREKMEDYGIGTISCMEEDENGKKYEINYTNMNCPVCDGYLPLAVEDGVDSDNYGFKCSKHCKAKYGVFEDLSMDKYLDKLLGSDEDSEVDENS